jgi:hypothetical protein
MSGHYRENREGALTFDDLATNTLDLRQASAEKQPFVKPQQKSNLRQASADLQASYIKGEKKKRNCSPTNMARQSLQ